MTDQPSNAGPEASDLIEKRMAEIEAQLSERPIEPWMRKCALHILKNLSGYDSFTLSDAERLACDIARHAPARADGERDKQWRDAIVPPCEPESLSRKLTSTPEGAALWIRAQGDELNEAWKENADARRRIAELEKERGEWKREAKLFTWICAVAQASGLHMDGTCQWRIPSHTLPRAKSLTESIELAIKQAKE